MRLLGIDYGTRRTGIALATIPERLACPLAVLEGRTDNELVAWVAQTARAEAVDCVVVGMPLNADGTVGSQARITQRFVSQLSAVLPCAVATIDEHLTSFHAEQQLAGSLTRNKRRKRIDSLAAARILQDYLDHHPNG